MARKLMVCSKCFNMFGIDSAKTSKEKVKCPKCGNGEVMGVYEYWRGVPTSGAGFKHRGAVEPLEPLAEGVEDDEADQGEE